MVAISETVERLVRDMFDLEAQPPKTVKGVESLIAHYHVVAERDVSASMRGPRVGRERELASLQRRWAEATAGTLATPGIAFQGEGGIGKTRLAYAAVDMAEQAGAVVLGLFGSPFHTDVGLRPVRRMLEGRCGIGRDADAPDRIRLLEAEVRRLSLDPATVVPLLAPVLGIGPEGGYEPVGAGGGKLYERIAEGIHSYLLACLGTGPGLVLAEDMHWFDEDTTEVVQALLREDSGRLLVVMTGRQLPSLPPGTEVFDLKPLSDAEADELILALDPEMEPDARRAVQERCDGIPLFIEEVMAKLKEQGSDAAESARVPDTLYEALFARLQSSTEALFVIEAAALIGSRFDRGLLSDVVEMDKHQVDDVLRQLGRGRVFQPAGETSWRFQHELLREVAAELSPPSLRRRLHSRIADALVAAAADGTPEWPLVAHHYGASSAFRRGGGCLPESVGQCPAARRAERSPLPPHPRTGKDRAVGTQSGARSA
jgi:predicted ATPase